METNQDKDQGKQMMNEEYSREFGGCLWMILAAVIGLTIFGIIYLFT